MNYFEYMITHNVYIRWTVTTVLFVQELGRVCGLLSRSGALYLTCDVDLSLATI